MDYNIPISDLLNNEYSSISTDIYAIDCYTNKIVYANMPLSDPHSNGIIGRRCYEVFKHRSNKCDNCNAFFNDISEVLTLECTNDLKTNSFASAYKMNNSNNNIILITVGKTEKINEYHKHLKELAFYDTAFGIKNYSAFCENLQYLLKYKKNSGYLVLFNIYNYKLMQDSFGKAYTDDLFNKYINCLKELVVSDNLYSISKKDFILILENNSRSDVIRLLNLIHSYFNSSFNYQNDSSLKCSLSVGFVPFPKYSDDCSDVTAYIDYLITKCENSGHNSYVEFDDTMYAQITRKNKIIKILNDAVNNNLFEVYFQPIFDVKKRIYNKAEALLRLNNTEIGSIPPSEFIPIAEETGMIIDIGKLVLEKSCTKIRELLDKKYVIECINVNVSPIELKSDKYCSYVIELIKKYNIPKGMLELEVTEGVLINSFESCDKVFKELISNGVVFALDDFGTGYSALSYLINMPVSTIKLDRSFVAQITNSVNNIIVEGIVNIAKKLNMSIIAEGVETKNQFDILASCGCESIQGFYFSKPVPFENINASFIINK